MTKSKTTRALLAASCVAGSACVSGPQHRQPPKPADCPPGADATHKRFNIIPMRPDRIIVLPYDLEYSFAVVSEGPATAEILPPWGSLPRRMRIDGELFFAKGHVYGRFTRAHLPNGEIVPVCLRLWAAGRPGVAMESGSTPEKARVHNTMSLQPVERFE